MMSNWDQGAFGGTFLCTNFLVEEDNPDKFLIYCEAPFGA
jgi:hypothetical protein